MMIAMLIEREVEITLNWSFASALAVVLLAPDPRGLRRATPHRPAGPYLRGAALKNSGRSVRMGDEGQRGGPGSAAVMARRTTASAEARTTS